MAETAKGTTMANMAKAEVGRRIIEALEQVANDPNEKPAKRRSAARKAAEWKAAREA